MSASAAAKWLTVVGIGEDGLEGLAPAARRAVESAEVLVGGERHLALVPDGPAQRIAWAKPLEDTFAEIAAHRGRRVTVLASGDPMHYGIGPKLIERFGLAETAIVPAPGALSLACARLGWGLADVETVRPAGRARDALHRHLRHGARLLILSEDGRTPARVAAALVERGLGPSRMIVFECLGGPEERRREARAQDWKAGAADLNTIAVECLAEPGAVSLPLVPGLPDEAFEHDGLITKREVRAATVAALSPLPGALLWDVGAGCGSVAIEWLRAEPRARAVAVERTPARTETIARNAAALGVPALETVAGAAPAALRGLAAPDAVFVGGGVSDEGLLAACWEALRPGGRLVANAVTVESEAALVRFREARGGSLTRLSVERVERIGGLHGWKPLRAVTQLCAVKPVGPTAGTP